MSALQLEDFGGGLAPRPSAAPTGSDPVPGVYEDGYNAGWDDALAQITEEHGRIGETLAERLAQVEQTREEAMIRTLRALDPLLHDVFDKILPRAVERGFLPLLLQEAEALLTESETGLTLLVAPEDVPALETLLESRDDLQDLVSVKAEPALALSQALVTWEGGQRRLDMQAVMAALDAAFEDFLTEADATPQLQEAAHG